MTSYLEIAKRNAGQGQHVDYEQVVRGRPVTETDLKDFEELIKWANSGNIPYDCFCDNGGIEVAAILLAEVRRLASL